MAEKSVIQVLASTIQARQHCIKQGNGEWQAKHEATLDDIVRNRLPHGSGFDSGCKIDLDKSTSRRVVFQADFHHMDSNGYYDSWTDHTVTVTPAFDGVEVKISGRDRNDFKDYAHEVIYFALLQPYKHD